MRGRQFFRSILFQHGGSAGPCFSGLWGIGARLPPRHASLPCGYAFRPTAVARTLYRLVLARATQRPRQPDSHPFQSDLLGASSGKERTAWPRRLSADYEQAILKVTFRLCGVSVVRAPAACSRVILFSVLGVLSPPSLGRLLTERDDSAPEDFVRPKSCAALDQPSFLGSRRFPEKFGPCFAARFALRDMLCGRSVGWPHLVFIEPIRKVYAPKGLAAVCGRLL